MAFATGGLFSYNPGKVLGDLILLLIRSPHKGYLTKISERQEDIRDEDGQKVPVKKSERHDVYLPRI